MTNSPLINLSYHSQIPFIPALIPLHIIFLEKVVFVRGLWYITAFY